MSSDGSVDQNPDYWADYTNLQRVKHHLIKNYLNGWFPKLGTRSGRIIYLDTHAGRGKHVSGEYGSPLVALQTFLDHNSRDRILGTCEVVFFFIERDQDNLALLTTEVEQFHPLPQNVRVEKVAGDSFRVLEEVIRDMKAQRQRLAPAFVFVDPYGFKIPGSILRELMVFRRVELFVNVIWRELDMAIRQGPTSSMAPTLDFIFDGPRWRQRIVSDDFDGRIDQASNLFKEMTGAQWATHIRMLGDNEVTRYLLLHLTNHHAGIDLMKDCVWKVCPDGGFVARKSDNLAQQYLITPEPDLAPLHTWVLDKLSKGPRRWQQLLQELRGEIWLERDLNTVIREMRRKGIIFADEYEGSFNPKSNPRLSLRRGEPGRAAQ